MTFHVAHDGASLSFQKIENVRFDGELVYAKSSKQSLALAITDVFAVAVEGATRPDRASPGRLPLRAERALPRVRRPRRARRRAPLVGGARAAPAPFSAGCAGSVLRIRAPRSRPRWRAPRVADPAPRRRAMYRGARRRRARALLARRRARRIAGAEARTPRARRSRRRPRGRALRGARARGPSSWPLRTPPTGSSRLRRRAGASRRTARASPSWSSRSPVGAFHAFCTHLRRACGLVLIAAGGRVRQRPGAPRRGRRRRDAHRSGARSREARRSRPVPRRARRSPIARRAALARATGATLLVVAASRDGRVQRGHLLARARPP